MGNLEDRLRAAEAASQTNKLYADNLLNDRDRLIAIVRSQAAHIQWLQKLINFLGDDPESDRQSRQELDRDSL